MDEREDFATAIAAQPRHMRLAAALAADALHDVTPWQAGDTVVVTGMGSSTNAGAVFTEALRARGVRAVNIDAAAFAHYPVGFTPGEHVIVISESGRSPEPIEAARRMGGAPIVVTNNSASPIAQVGGTLVPLGGFKDSGVYTIGYTTTLVALAAIAEAHGVPVADPMALADVAEQALAQFEGTLGPVAAALDGASFIDIVGQGVSAGSAQAAALLFRESCGLATAAHQTIQYLHGPMESCGPSSAALIFGDARELGVAAQLREAGTLVIGFAAHPGGDVPGLHRLDVAADGLGAAVAEVVFAQLLACELAGLRHRDVGHFRFPQDDTKLLTGFESPGPLTDDMIEAALDDD